jgi:hypothetical protein
MSEPPFQTPTFQGFTAREWLIFPTKVRERIVRDQTFIRDSPGNLRLPPALPSSPHPLGVNGDPHFAPEFRRIRRCLAE